MRASLGGYRGAARAVPSLGVAGCGIGDWMDGALGFPAERIEHTALRALVGEARLGMTGRSRASTMDR